jgi:hypothetical protein
LRRKNPEEMKVTERDAAWDRYYQESLKTQTKDDAERLADSIWMFRTRSAEVPRPTAAEFTITHSGFV